MLGLPMAEDRPDCDRCDRRAGCGQVVWGAGPSPANILLLGEAPGSEEDLMGDPFVSREGRHLRKLLDSAGIGDAYLTYAVKCAGAAPTKEQANACRSWLWQELQVVNPAVVVTLGRLPTKMLLGLKQSFVLKNVVGEFRPVGFMKALVAPWYGPNQLLQRGRDSDTATVAFFNLVKEKADNGNREVG